MSIVIVAALLLGYSGDGEELTHATCTCEVSKSHGGWCHACDLGHVAGIAIKSQMLFEALDAHGHHIDPKLMKCKGCKEALATDGFCKNCQWGFVDKQLYHSKLTYYLAKGKPKAKSASSCSACKAHTGKPTWCESCKIGAVGNVAYTDKATYQSAAVEYGRLRQAVELSGKCEDCGVAFFMGTKCLKCNISYKDGKQLPQKGP